MGFIFPFLPNTIASIWQWVLICVRRNMPVACGDIVADPRSNPMLDVIYILIGAAFLGGCVLYAFACDRL
jgi:hypothetical protein